MTGRPAAFSAAVALPISSSRCSLRWRMPRQPMASRKVRSITRPSGPSAPRLVLVDIVERRAGIEAGGDRRSSCPAKTRRPTRIEGAAHRPVEASRREQGERRGQPVGLVACVAGAVGRASGRRGFWRRRELAVEERRDQRRAPCARSRSPSVSWKKPGSTWRSLVGLREIDEEFVLRAMPHDPVAARDQQLRRHGDGAGIRDDARGVLVEFEQDVGGDRPGDQRIGLEGGDALGVMRQEASP